MEITQQELGTYTPLINVPLTNVPDAESRIRILSCLNHVPPIISFTLYEGTVQHVIHNPAVFSNQIILHPGANEFVVFNRANTGNGIVNGNIQFPLDAWDFNLYYWKYIALPDNSMTKYNPIDSYPSLKRERPIEPEPIKLEQPEPASINPNTRRRLFAGKSRRKTKRRKSLK